jgi:hypothetical protein
MVSQQQLKEQIYRYIDAPLNPGVNFDTGLYYESLGQTAAALSFFLRCAELTESDLLAYEALLKTHKCIATQTRRPVWEKEQLMIAMTHMPKRPEAYFLLSQWHSHREEWTEAHYYAVTGQKICDFDAPSLNSDVGYVGHWGLKFQEAFTCWWRGLREHSIELWKELYVDPNIDNEEYFTVILNNLKNFNVLPTEHDPIVYVGEKFKELQSRMRFAGCKRIDHTNSQALQDLFVLRCWENKHKGTYLEIGGGKPYSGNNTALLEHKNKWKGLSIDLHQPYVDEWNKSLRDNPIIREDAVHLNYLDLIKEYKLGTEIDYLSIDIDPAYQSLEVLKRIPFEEIKFGVITFEHDHYNDSTRKVRKLSRNILESHGYILVAGNISMDENCPFEDWWVHPHLINEETIEQIKVPLTDVLPVKNYIFK